MYFGLDYYCESEPCMWSGNSISLSTHSLTHTHARTDVAYKFEDLLQPPVEDQEEGGETSDATLTYEQEDDSELTLDYEQEEPVKDEAKIEKESIIHPPGVEEKEKEVVKSKKRKLEDSGSEPPPGAKRTLSCAKKKKKKEEPAMAEGQGDQQGKDEKETSVDGSSQSVNVKSAASGVGGAAATKPSLEKKDSMEENLICQICQV